MASSSRPRSGRPATKLDAKTRAACDTRNIKLFRAGATNNLVDFTWNTVTCDASGNPTGTPATALDTTEQDYFTAGGTTDEITALSQYGLMTDGTSGTVDQRAAARGANLVNFLRGQRGKEGTTPFTPNDANKLYRQRRHVLGDIVNSQPLFVRGAAFSYGDTGYATFAASVASRQPMVYVAANDGMLHAFTLGCRTAPAAKNCGPTSRAPCCRACTSSPTRTTRTCTSTSWTAGRCGTTCTTPPPAPGRPSWSAD